MDKARLLSFSDLERNDAEKTTNFTSLLRSINQSCKDFGEYCRKAIDMGRKDPRKITHAVKFGSALSLVSLLIFIQAPLDVSQFWIWAILTVIVMFEFSVGATFIKGFNRGLGTFCAGMVAFFFGWLSSIIGHGEKVVIVISFFITGAFAYYLKLYPTMAPYEYGYRVFVLTFCILMVAGNRNGEYTVAVLTRLVLIGVGALTCFVINILIFPIWSGDDLHRLVVNNFEELASSLEDCVKDYMESTTTHQFNLGYKNVIANASKEQTLLGFAIWEPSHGRYRASRRRYPWKKYAKLSNAVRHCSYSVMALHGCILSEIQAPYEKRRIFRAHLERVAAEGANVLREIGKKLDRMEKLSSDDDILSQVHDAAEQLQKKIDQTSYVLVNAEHWEIRGRAAAKVVVVVEDPQQHGNNTAAEEDQYDDARQRNWGLKCLSETAIRVDPPLMFSASEMDFSAAAKRSNLRKVVRWPSRVSLEGDGGGGDCDGGALVKEDEVKTYESASALSLATFVSILIEFVARLQSVVDCFEELSEEAEFREADVVVLTDEESRGWRRRFWTRFCR